MTAKTWIELLQESVKNKPELTYDQELQMQYEEEDHHINEALELAKSFYLSLSDVEMNRWESSIRPVYEEVSIDKYFFREHINKKENKLKELEIYYKSSGLSDRGFVAELETEKREYLKRLSKYQIGRELISNYEPEVFLRLFDLRPNLHIYSTKGICLTNEVKFSQIREEIEDSFANYKAIDDKLASFKKPVISGKINKNSKTLKDILKDPSIYDSIINFLVHRDLIDADSKKFIERKSNYLEMTGLLQFLSDKRQLKEALTQKLAEETLSNTFDFKVTQYNFTNRSLTPKNETQLIKLLNIKQ